MTVSIHIQLPTGLLHSTPWGSSANENQVELPPSPWRILRAIVAKGLQSEVEPTLLNRLLEQLAAHLPCYHIPHYTKAHKRHWMPVNRLEKGQDKVALVFDTFAAFEPGATLTVTWDLTLSPQQFALLTNLCEQINYLGRAESLAILSTSRKPLPANYYNAVPEQTGSTPVLAPLSSVELVGFNQAIAALPAEFQTTSPPQTVLDALCLEIHQMREQGWSQVPGAKLVYYSIHPTPTPKPSRIQFSKTGLECNLVRVSLVANPLPPVTQSLLLGENIRQRLLAQTDHILVSGKDPDGSPTKQEHLFFLPEIDDRHHIKSLLVYLRTGEIPIDIIRALQTIDRCWDRRWKRDIRTVLTLTGWAKDYQYNFATDPFPPNGSMLLAHAQVWRSLTPLLLTRHPSYRNNRPRINPETGLHRDGVEDQVIRLLKHRGFPSPQEITRIQGTDYGHSPWHRFIRRRKQYSPPTSDIGYGVQITFAEPVGGPITIGYGSQFGLGVFIPVE